MKRTNFYGMKSLLAIALVFSGLSLNAQSNWGIFARFRFGEGVKFVKSN